MNEELRRALKQLLPWWNEANEERIWPLFERWHNAQVAIVTGQRDGARQARDAVLADNQRLREENERFREVYGVLGWGPAAEAHAEPHPECEGPKQEPRLPLCVRCGKPMSVGEMVGHRVQPDGTIGPEHRWRCPPEEGAQR